jgi:2-methylisocitrate lyase-like PEP mutase family enzyme
VIYPVTALFAAVHAMQQAMAALRRDGNSANFQDALIRFDDFNAFIGLPAVRELEQRYAVPAS